MKYTFLALTAILLVGAGCSWDGAQNAVNSGLNTVNSGINTVNNGLNSLNPGSATGGSVVTTTNVTPPTDTNAKNLNLSGQNLKSIPEYVFSMTQLENLDLSNNELTGAPQSQIGNLTNLKTLNLKNNNLTVLPAELGRLSSLVSLDVSDNRLTGLPLEIGDLNNLKNLDVSGNDYSKDDLNKITAKLKNTTVTK